MTNFRNFHDVDVQLAKNAIIVGENKSGKSNLLYALRLVLDASLPEASRLIRCEDIWSGIPRPIPRDTIVQITVELSDFWDNANLRGLLTPYRIASGARTARLIFQAHAHEDSTGITKDSDLESQLFGGSVDGEKVDTDTRRRIRLEVIQALRDADRDLNNWRHSPARILLEQALAGSAETALEQIAIKISQSNEEILRVPSIQQLDTQTRTMMEKISGSHGPDGMKFGLEPANVDRLVRTIRILIDQGTRSLADESLGLSNVIYIGLKYLESLSQIDEGDRDFTVLAIEEPEAHLHPTLQRTVFSSFMSGKHPITQEDVKSLAFLLTTHSPHIVSISPVRALVRVARTKTQGSRIYSTAALDLKPEEEADLARYLDVTRGEMVFAKGVLFVEGDAERYIIPQIAKAMGLNLDALGIFVCSISGTNFKPYVQLARGLHIPFVVMTDGDPTTDHTGADRLSELHSLLTGGPSTDMAACEAAGLFRGAKTLELDLLMSSVRPACCQAGMAAATTRPMRKRFEDARPAGAPAVDERLLKDIEIIGKGRYAQALAGFLSAHPIADFPPVLGRALTYLQIAVS